jgi:hypothetical protein
MQHIATLRLCQDDEGVMWLTVDNAHVAIVEAERRGDGTMPMHLMAEWLTQAASLFARSWGSLTPRPATRA